VLKPLWALFAAVSGAVVLFGLLVVAMVSGDEPTRSPSVVTSVGIIAVVGVVAILAVFRVRWTLACGSEAELASAYVSRFVFRIAIAESPGLVGVALSLLAGSVWPYLAAVPYVAIGLWLAAPTMRAIEAESQRLAEQACGASLVSALTRPSAGPLAQ
jgi:hypothetical protein